MATDIETTPKQSTIMDCMKTSSSPCTSTKKSKGIRDFFSSSSNTSSIADNGVLESLETQAHAKAVSEVDTEKSSASKIEQSKKKGSKSIEENGVSDKKQKNKKPHQTDNDSKQSVSLVNSNQSSACNSEHATTKLSAGKKKSLSISKKAKDKKSVECVREPDEKKEEDVPPQEETKDMPQEMDYGEFLKTFVQNQNDSFSELDSTADKEKEQSSPDDKQVQSCSEAKNTQKQCGTKTKKTTDSQCSEVKNTQKQCGTKTKKTTDSQCSEVKNTQKQCGTKTKKTDSQCSEAKKTQKQCGTKTKRITDSQSANVEKSKVQGLIKTKPANAFSILMQAKPNKGKEKPVDEDECAETNGASHGKSSSSAEIDNDTADEFDGLISDVETVRTPSLLNFFSKETKKSTAKSNECGSSVLVKVDIHRDPTEQKTTPIRKKANNLHLKKVGKRAKSSPDSDNEIVFLGSETIEIEEDDVNPPRSKKRCLSKAQSHPEPAVKTSDDAKPKYSSTEEAIRLENKNAFLQDITTSDQPVKTAQATLHFGQGGQLAMNTSVIAKSASKTAICDSQKIDSTETPQKGTKGKCSEKEVCSEICEQKTTRITKRKRDKSVVLCETTVTKGRPRKDHPRQKSLLQKKKNNTKNKRTTRIRKLAESDAGSGSNYQESSGSDAKDFTPRSKRTAQTGPAKRSRAHELLMKAMQQKHDSRQKNLRGKKSKHQKRVVSVGKKKQKDAEKVETAVVPREPEQGTRRQSRRLAEQQKAREATEALNTSINVVSDSDSGSETAPTPQKKTTRKKESCASLRRSSPRSSPKKPAGKLAPIFAKKTKETVESSPKKPQEDPEVVRRRREFLLSGVPTELKKQAACSAASVITSDFAPFPEDSHVQQQASVETGCLNVWALGTPAKMRTLCKEKPAGDEISRSSLKWDSLQWPPVVLDDSDSAEFKPLEPVCDVLVKDVREQMMEDLQQSQPGFSVSTLCDKFREVLSSATATAAAKQEFVSDVSTPKRKKKRTDPDVVIIDEQEDVSTTQTDKDSQWPERLQPTCASELIGNESSIRRLRFWLEEWKTLIQREARLSVRSAAGKDSDFDYSSEEEEEGQLCNTMMLVGPHGVGKTAAVYALAQQLSFKVFEVNASSSRQGRHILAQLQEATQSHQVAQKKDGIVLNPPPVTPTSSSQPEQSVEKKSSKKKGDAVPKAFASFFKKSENVTEAKTTPRHASPEVDKRRKTRESPKKNAKKDKASVESKAHRKRMRGADDVEIVEETPAPKKRCRENKGTERDQCQEGGEEGNLAGCLNLTSTSLILFDEVDLVFGEDSGFLQTVQHFINTTKIPIILTTTDCGFQRRLTARLETLVFKTPPLECVSSYLRTVCLAVGMRTSGEDVRELVSLCRGDVRRALLHLQFLALSGGGRLKESQPLRLRSSEQHTAPEKKGHGEQALPVPAASLANGDGSDSDGDFVCLKPFRKKPRRIVDEEDSGSPLKTVSDGKQSERVRKGQGQDSGKVVPADQLPAVHLHLYESMLGVPGHLHDLLARSIKDEYNATCLQQLTEMCVKLKASNIDILHTNLLHLLPLPKTGVPDRWQRPSHASAAAVKRKRIRSDIYDSEGSDDESSHQKTEPASLKTVEEVKNDRGHVETSAEMSADSGSVVKNGKEGVVESEERTGESVAAVESMEVGDSPTNGEVDNSVHSQAPKVGTEHQEKEVKTEASLKVSCENGESSKRSMKGSQKCTDGGLGSKLLSSFARHYESLSAVDMSAHSLDLSLSPRVRGGCPTQPGIEDVPSGEQGSSEDWGGEGMAVETEALSCRKLWQQVSTCVSSWKEESCSDRLPDGCSIPLPAASSSLAFGKVSMESRVPESYSKVMTEVGDNLPSTVSSTAIALDYLPTLRCISQAERCRQIAKTKRRFHHHFDNIGLCLSQATVAALSADFLAGQPDSSNTPVV